MNREFFEFSGKTVDDAVTEALIKLETTSDKIEYEIVEKGSTGFLGMFSVYGPVNNFVSNYVFDVKGLLYFCVMTALFLFLTVQSVHRRQYR